MKGITGRVSLSPETGWRAIQTRSRSDCAGTERPVPTKPEAFRYKDLSRCAHHFPPRFGVKQDYGDPFGLSMVCAVVFHPGRYEGAWGRSRKGRDYFRRKNNKSSEAAGEKKIHQTTRLVLVVSMGTTPFTKAEPHVISRIHFCT